MQKNFALAEIFLPEISECFCTLSSKIVENTRILDLAQNLHLYKGKAG